MSDVVLSVVGDRDPVRTDGKLGPVATYFAHLPADVTPRRVVLFWTPGHDPDSGAAYEERAQRTADWLRDRHAGLRIELTCLGEADASDFERIAGAMWRSIDQLVQQDRAARWHVLISSGSQQMAWAWATAVLLGLLPARIWQAIDPDRQRSGSPPVVEFQVGRAVDAFLADPQQLEEVRGLERTARQLEGALGRLARRGRPARVPPRASPSFPIDLDEVLDLVRWNLRQRALDDAGRGNAWKDVKRALGLTVSPNAVAQRTRAIEARLLAHGTGLRLLPVDHLLDVIEWFSPRSELPTPVEEH
ncbi:MAG: hypothetical protein KatS3mg060_2873 [Dehalococcoidia bacterium]|nr:MAG: hypothetical protein KatS3mg060_2873 [Dehalococcoidia bacterium]